MQDGTVILKKSVMKNGEEIISAIMITMPNGKEQHFYSVGMKFRVKNPNCRAPLTIHSVGVVVGLVISDIDDIVAVMMFGGISRWLRLSVDDLERVELGESVGLEFANFLFASHPQAPVTVIASAD